MRGVWRGSKRGLALPRLLGLTSPVSSPSPSPAAPARIALLSPLAIDQIAAGEVVERPASVVKELVDNAIDAGSTRVDVELEDGGLTLIAVRDNGRGIHPDDLLLAVTRHATSKLRDPSELTDIGTLGFRGEALASIAAVARLDLRSRQPSAAVGTHLHVRPGEPPRMSPAGLPVGTQIEVHSLFANLPARRKFMRAEATEVGQCSEVLLRLAVVHPEVHLTLRHGKRELLNLPRGTLEQRVTQVLGRRVAGPLFGFAGEEDGTGVQVWLPTPEAAGRGRGGPYLVVRRRVVKERSLAQIVAQAYGLGGEATACVFVEPPRASVDVNVHPQKSEVRFSDPQRVYAAVRRVLAAAMQAAPWGGAVVAAEAPVLGAVGRPSGAPLSVAGMATPREGAGAGSGSGSGEEPRASGPVRGGGAGEVRERREGWERGEESWSRRATAPVVASEPRPVPVLARDAGGQGWEAPGEFAGPGDGLSGGTGVGRGRQDDGLSGGTGAGQGEGAGPGNGLVGGTGREPGRGEGLVGGTGRELGRGEGLVGGTGRSVGGGREEAVRPVLAEPGRELRAGYRLSTRALAPDYDLHKRGVMAEAATLRPASEPSAWPRDPEPVASAVEAGLPALFAPEQLAPAPVLEDMDGVPQLPTSERSSGPLRADLPHLLTCLPGPVALFAERDTLLAIDLRRLRSHLVYLRLQRDLIGRRVVAVQGLLAPAVVRRPAEEVALIVAARAELLTLGVDLDDFGGDAVVVRGVPAHLRHCVDDADVADLIARIVPWLRMRTRESDASAVERGLLGAIAATRGGDPAPRLARRWLAELLDAGATLADVPGLRRWTAAALLGEGPAPVRRTAERDDGATV